MKKLINIALIAAMFCGVSSCEIDHDPIVVLPDVVLDNSGLTTIRTVTSYANDKYTVVLTRTEGLSKPADFDIVVDETLLREYNELNSADMVMMPSSLYTVSATEIIFKATEKTASFEITFKPKDIISAAGSLSAAQKYLIPFVCIPRSDINSPDNRLNSLVRLSFDDPVITTETSGEQNYAFISVSRVPRTITLEATTNFDQIDLNDLRYETGQSYVDEYNNANGTDYVLMPASGYSWINAFQFDYEKQVLTRDLSVMCADLDPGNVYLLPLSLKSSKYQVDQGRLLYIRASVTELEIIFKNDHLDPKNVINCVLNKPETITLNVNMNAALEEDNPLEFTYDPAKVAAYNTANGKKFYALDASKVKITNSNIAAGETKGAITIEFDLTTTEFESGLFLVPVTIDKSKLPYIPNDLDETIYYVVRRSIVGFWYKNYWVSSERPFPENNPGNGGKDWGQAEWIRSESHDLEYYAYLNPGANVDKMNFNGKFKYFNCYYMSGITNAFLWYVDWNGSVGGDPNKKPVIAYRTNGDNFPAGDAQWEAKFNAVKRQDSYYDLSTGMLWTNLYWYTNYNDIGRYDPSNEADAGGKAWKTRYMGEPSYTYFSPVGSHPHPLIMDNWR